jgi:hypothetical protein
MNSGLERITCMAAMAPKHCTLLLPPTLQAANLSNPPDNATWTFCAPDNDGFNESNIQSAAFNLTTVQLLEPANKAVLAKVRRKRVLRAAVHVSAAVTMTLVLH